MKVRISDGLREVEVEADGNAGGLPELEATALRLYEVVSDGRKPLPVGFAGNGWALSSDMTLDPDR